MNSPQDLSMDKINSRINEIFDELRGVGPETQDAELIRKAIPLLIELNDLKDQKLRVIQEIIDEVNRHMWDNEERIMELEGVPMTENLATKFIHDKGLEKQFEAYVGEQVERVFRDAGDKPSRLQ